MLKREGINDWSDLRLDNVISFGSNENIDLGVTQLQILHLPGHSPGHSGVYETENQILFIGDIDLSGKFGPWYGWWNSELDTFKKSVEYVIDFVSRNEISRIVSSHTHDVSKEEGIHLLNNFLNSFDAREQQIKTYITQKRTGVTLKQIVDQSIIYQGKQSDPPYVWEYFESVHVKKHIEALMKKNEVISEGDIIFNT